MRFRFTIRDLLWLTALIAMGLGWWIDHFRHVERDHFMEVHAKVFFPDENLLTIESYLDTTKTACANCHQAKAPIH